MKFFRWLGDWWETWQVWRNADAEMRRILTAKGHDPDDFIEVQRP